MKKEEIDIEKFHKGDRSTFRSVYDGMYPSLCCFCTRFIRDAETAEDIVQEAFITLWSRRSEFTSTVHIRSFLYTTCRNASLDHLRHLRVRNRNEEALLALASQDNFSSFVIEEEVERVLAGTYSSLPSRCREIFSLSLSGYCNEEIAARLGISTNTVKTQKKIAYRRLKEYISYFCNLLIFFQN